MENFKFHNDAIMLKYHHRSLDSCCFSSLASAFVSIEQSKTTNAISLRIEEYLNIKISDRIDFANAIFEKRRKNSMRTKCVL